MSSSRLVSKMVDVDSTLGAIALQHDAYAAVFTRHDIDFLKGGKRTLREACREAGLDVDQLRGELSAELSAREDAKASRDWGDQPLGAVLDFVSDVHHTFTRRVLERITKMAPKVLAKHGDEMPELHQLAKLVDEFARDLSSHLADEETAVFPVIRAGEGISTAGDTLHGSSQTASNLDTNAISRLMAGHAHGEGLSLMAAMEVLTKGFVPPQGACTAVQALYAALAELRIDLTKHAALENDVLFPRAQARLRG